ncbi:MAG: RNA polymerase sigma factor RpoD/SigA [Chitinophagaceae bacterium]|nr:MAG: RNA polymerase sigma factor RpoD/SigA [Chitinophagaceae bacterium]
MRAIKIGTSITRREEHSLTRYLNELDHTELLTVEEEIALARKVRAGDQAALERLVKANLRFVVSVAKKYQHLGMPLPDLINEGKLGLIKAASLFDETKGFKFISYAVWWIRQGIMSALGESVRMIRLPGNMVRDTDRARKLSEVLEQQLEREPTHLEIAERMEVPNPAMALRYAFGRTVVSLDAPLTSNGEGEGELVDLLADEKIVSPDQGLMEASLRLDTQRMLKLLDSRERVIISESFGLCGREKNAEEIARELGMSSETVRQVRLKAIRKLRNRLVGKGSVHG